MKINEIKYMRRFNLGNYEHEEIALAAALDDNESPGEAFSQLKNTVHMLAIGQEVAAEEIPVAPPAPKEKPVKGKKAKVVEPEPEEIEEEEEVDDEELADEEIQEEEEEAEEAPTPSKGKKTFKKKPQTYSRASEQHKEILSKTLREVAPDWQKSQEGKQKAKSCSIKMEGEEFLDENGEVLPEFKIKVKKHMKK